MLEIGLMIVGLTESQKEKRPVLMLMLEKSVT